MKWRVLGILFPMFLIGLLAFLILSDKPKDSAAVIYAGSDDPGILDPQAISSGEQVRVTNNVFETLIRFADTTTDLVPGLASKWEVSKDGKSIDVWLRTGVKFHDGSDFNADAVAFTFARFNPKNEFAPKKIPYGSCFTDLEKVEIVNPTQVRFILKTPNAVFVQILATFCSAIVSPTSVKKGVDAFGRQPIGSGPYRLTEWQSGQKIVLERFEGYWGTKAPTAKVVITKVPDAPVRTEQLLNGQIHIMDNASLADVDALKKNPNVTVEFGEATNVTYLGFNMNHLPYSSPHFRQAVALAIDKNKLSQLAYYGVGQPARSIVPPSIWGHDPEASEPTMDRAKAKELLAKISNLPTTIELWFPTFSRGYMPEPAKVAQSIQDDLKQIGLDVKLSGFSRESYDNKVQEKTHPMILYGWGADYLDADNFLFALLHADSIANDGTNITFFNHAKFNELTKAAQSEMDQAKRRDLYKEAQRIYKEEVPSIPLMHVKPVVAYSKKLKYNRHPLEVRLWNLDWVK